MADQVELFLFEDDGRIPNNQLPLVLIRDAIHMRNEEAASELQARYARHGWGGIWRWGVYDFHHYHSAAHEVLGVFRGLARLRFGGERGPVVEVSVGDVVIIPAGVGHKCLEAHDGFQVVGGYPDGQVPDLRRGDEPDRCATLETIRPVPLPKEDPILGAAGPLIAAWRRREDAPR